MSSARAPNWIGRYVGDITYISTWEGWAYLATVIDLASRIVGWALADHMRTELLTDALEMAFTTRNPAGSRSQAVMAVNQWLGAGR